MGTPEPSETAETGTNWLLVVWWEKVWDRRWRLAWAAPLAVAAALVMGEISRLLETLATPDKFTYTAAALTGWPGFPPWENSDRVHAVEAWNAWAAVPAVNADRLLRESKLECWLTTHIVLDWFLFAPAYVLVLYLVLHRMLDFRTARKMPTAIPFGLPGITVLVSSLLVADWVETFFTYVLVRAGAGSIDAWAHAVAVLSALKWLLLGAVVFLGTAVFAVDILPDVLTRWFIRWREGISLASRSWTRHRVQLAVLTVLAALIALPGGGPLEQVPDIQRAWVHDRPWESLADIAGPVVTLTVLCAALWVAGRLALLDGLAGQRKKARNSLEFLRLFLGASIVLIVVWPLGSVRLWDEPFSHNAGALAIPVVLLAITVLGAFVTGGDPAARWVGHPCARAKVETIGRVLTIVPIVIAGLGLVRAFAGPVLLDQLVDTGVGFGWILMWFVIGLVVALVVPPLVYWLLERAESALFGNPGEATAKQLRRRNRWPWTMGVVLLSLVALVGLFTAFYPIAMGAWLRTLGALSLMFATVVLAGALFIRRAESREPYRAFRALRFRFTPIWLPALAVLATQSMLDSSGVYHAVRLHMGETSTDDGVPFSAQDEFKEWYAQAAACDNGADDPQAIPMVLVAAAGGGIRAAYWTSAAMDRLTAASPCARSYTFGLSGVSGGSLGLAAHTLAGRKPAGAKSSETVRELADEDALSANIAALLYRDGTHAFHGMNHIHNHTIEDRAAVFERAWEQTSPDEWKRELSSVTLRDTEWRPFLLMNGTDVASGCRIAVSAHRTTGVPLDDERLRCKKPNIADRGQFATATVDAAAFNDAADCSTRDRGLRMSTAAHLSARFTYVSPSGTMYRCARTGEGGPVVASSISSIDGGYLEGSGMSALLEFWSAVEPFVAAKNLEVAAHNLETAGPEKKLPYVVPLVVLLDNHYSTKAPDPELKPLDELDAPVTGYRARTTATRTETVQQEALVRFTGALPGTTLKVAPATPATPATRSFLVTPRTEPQIAAPLGWVLSDMSINSMDNQLKTLSEALDPSQNPGEDRLAAGQLFDLIRLLREPMTLMPHGASGPRPLGR
ncbi:hypothetical protein OG468_40145 [Streptomyces zaomyceticus]|uniref:hypothetical protein n=1 Tax=Streptomyces zaomyceticus TaxID=68286 RepID=UPI00324DB8A2